jgi:hypothetical protein
LPGAPSHRQQTKQKAPRLVGLRGAKLTPLWEETGVN